MNSKIIKISLFFLLTICVFHSPISAQSDEFEKIKATKTIKGKFIKFVVGDYIHLEIKTANGKIRYFSLDSYDLQYFLVVNRGKPMTFTYDVVESLRVENGKRIVIERIKSAKIGNLTFEKWWKNLSKKFSEQQIKKYYDPLVEKYTEYL